MAKGNDGNLFQHVIEVEAADFLIESTGTPGIYFAATHAMAPMEPFDADASRAKTSTALLSKLRVATSVGADAAEAQLHPLIVQAFSGLAASEKRYPNSAKFVQWVARRHRATFSGALTETEPSKIASLRSEFEGPLVKVIPGSWRQHLADLFPPANLATPWLFSMDPMKFTNGTDQDHDKMTVSDLARLAPLVSAYTAHDQPGVIAFFSYAMQRDQREHFLAALVTRLLPSLVNTCFGVLETLNFTSDYHVAALFSRDPRVLMHLRDRLLAIMPGRSRDHDTFPVPNNVFETLA